MADAAVMTRVCRWPIFWRSGPFSVIRKTEALRGRSKGIRYDWSFPVGKATPVLSGRVDWKPGTAPFMTRGGNIPVYRFDARRQRTTTIHDGQWRPSPSSPLPSGGQKVRPGFIEVRVCLEWTRVGEEGRGQHGRRTIVGRGAATGTGSSPKCHTRFRFPLALGWRSDNPAKPLIDETGYV
ncbi:MAG: hypothetical protein R3B95_10755 [Nitrospirales bacterium]|nr:hypothetical protein [Nitrospirales bacterium]